MLTPKEAIQTLLCSKLLSVKLYADLSSLCVPYGSRGGTIFQRGSIVLKYMFGRGGGIEMYRLCDTLQ